MIYAPSRIHKFIESKKELKLEKKYFRSILKMQKIMARRPTSKSTVIYPLRGKTKKQDETD